MTSELKLRFLRRLKRFAIRALIAIYLLGVLSFGYWYWMRPVRADQFRTAHRKWNEIAHVFGVPVPKDERWGR